MHSRAEADRARPPPAAARAAALVLVATALVAPVGAAAAPTPAPTIRPSAASMTATPRAALEVAAVEAAASAVRADPDLGSVRKQRTWRLRDQARPDDPPTTLDPFWISLARWLAEGGRGLVWLLGAVALAIVLVAARRWLAVHGESVDARGARLPSHVRELDIRPESLPADIGAAVRSSGSPASGAPRSRSSTAARCRDWSTRTRWRSALRAPKAIASASRAPRCRASAATSSLPSCRRGSSRSMVTGRSPPMPCCVCARTSTGCCLRPSRHLKADRHERPHALAAGRAGRRRWSSPSACG